MHVSLLTYASTLWRPILGLTGLLLLLLCGVLVQPAPARPPEAHDLTQTAFAASEAMSGVASDAVTSFYFQDFDAGAAGWAPITIPSPDTYWNRTAGITYYQTGFEPPDFQLGPMDGQGGWVGYAGETEVQNSVVNSGTQAIRVHNADTGSSLVYRLFDLDLTGKETTLGLSANLSSGVLSYWTALQIQLDNEWIGINVEPSGQVVVVYPGPIHHNTGVYVTRDVWFDLSARLNFVSRTMELTFDGATIFTGAFPGTSNYLLYCYMNGAGEGTTDSGYFDDFFIESAPAWWCGTDDPCVLQTPPGYGNSWDQHLEKTVGPLSSGASLTLAHRYDVEEAWDFCYVDVSADDGVSYDTVAEFTGNSGGSTETVLDLSAYAGQTVVLRFRVLSDSGYSDADGNYDSNGAWYITGIQLDGIDLMGDETGWNAFPGSLPPPWTTFRLEEDPVCALGGCPDAFGKSWVAYDPQTGVVPLIDPPQDLEVGIESPEIPLPSSYDQIILDFSMYLNLPHANSLFMGWEVSSIVPGACPTAWYDENFVYYGVAGWSCSLDSLRGKFDITQIIAPGATAVKIRLTMNDIRWIWGGTGSFTDGIYFDNVHLMAVNSPDPGITVPDVCAPPEPQYVTVSGHVLSDCDGPLHGVTVDLNHPQAGMFTTTTDESGAYAFMDVPYSEDEGVVAMVPPLGYEPAAPPEGMEPLVFGEDHVVNFSLTCLEPVGNARTIGYWKHQANVHLNQRGNAQESLDDMNTNYPALIFGHFYANELNDLVVEGVTYEIPDTVARPLTLDRIHTTLTVKGGAQMLDRAKQQYLAVLLNLASGKLLTSSVVSEDGGTASQAVQQVADLLNNGNPGNDELAKTICDEINNARLIAAGVIDLGLGQIAYSRNITARPVTLHVAPTPFRGSTVAWFSLVQEGLVRVDVYDALGRKVRNLFQAWAPAGETQLTWDGADDQGRTLSSGVYYVRVLTQEQSLSRPLVMLR